MGKKVYIDIYIDIDKQLSGHHSGIQIILHRLIYDPTFEACMRRQVIDLCNVSLIEMVAAWILDFSCYRILADCSMHNTVHPDGTNYSFITEYLGLSSTDLVMFSEMRKRQDF